MTFVVNDYDFCMYTLIEGCGDTIIFGAGGARVVESHFDERAEKICCEYC